MTEQTIQKLSKLAEQFEIKDFTKTDPSQFLDWYKAAAEIELASFITALLSFGSRTQFIPKITWIFKLADKKGGIYRWIKNKDYLEDFTYAGPEGLEKKFYRFYSYADLITLFERLNHILSVSDTLGNFFKQKLQASENKDKPGELALVISSCFPDCKIVPKGKDSANKRIHMFLRWMVRTGSPVDKGLWTWYKPDLLVIPLDVHVLEESKKMSLIPENASASLKTALKITEELKQIWPDDPCRGDFALFGLGVNPED